MTDEQRELVERLLEPDSEGRMPAMLRSEAVRFLLSAQAAEIKRLRAGEWYRLARQAKQMAQAWEREAREMKERAEKAEVERDTAYARGLDDAAKVCDDLETKSNRPAKCAAEIRALATQKDAA